MRSDSRSIEPAAPARAVPSRTRRGPRLGPAAALVLLCALGPPAHGDVSFSIYGNSDFALTQAKDTATSFSIPAFDLFFAATKGRLQFLAELNFEFDGNDPVHDLERVQVAYLFHEALRVGIGRYHTALGYYNDTFHHGTYFQLPTARPLVVGFEDKSGLLMTHLVGLHADGRVKLGKRASLRYDFEVGNGRGSSAGEVTNQVDPNKFKYVGLRLRLEPIDGLMIGANVAIDEIPASQSAAGAGASPMAAVGPIREQLFGAHLVYNKHPIQLVSELHVLRHRDTTTDKVYSTYAWFAELGVAIGDFWPYLGYEQVIFPDTMDPYFANAAIGQRGSFFGVFGGLKWVGSDHVALKVEGRHDRTDLLGNITTVTAQCAFAF